MVSLMMGPEVLGAAWVVLVCLSLFGWGDALRRLLRMRCGAGEPPRLLGRRRCSCRRRLARPPASGPASHQHWTRAGGRGRRHLARSRSRYQTSGDPQRHRKQGPACRQPCAYGVRHSFRCYHFRFQFLDDYSAYMVFPVKMLTGSLGFEPFSERRLVTSLGGLYYLQSLILTGAGFHWLHIIDPVFALLVLIALLNEAMRARRVPLRQRLLICLFLLLFLPRTHNLTGTLLLVPLLFVVYLSVDDPAWVHGRSPLQRSIGLSIITAAQIAVKPAQLPLLGLFLAGAYLFQKLSEGRRNSTFG